MNRSRRTLTAVAVTLAGAALVGRPAPAQAQSLPPPVFATPRPLVVADFIPGVGRPVCTVENFNGLVAVAHLSGTGVDNKGATHDFDLDVRVMQGVYIDRMGFSRFGTLVFT